MIQETTFRIKLLKECWVVTNSTGKEFAQPQPVRRAEKPVAIEFAKALAFRSAPAVIEVFTDSNVLDSRIYIDRSM